MMDQKRNILLSNTPFFATPLSPTLCDHQQSPPTVVAAFDMCNDYPRIFAQVVAYSDDRTRTNLRLVGKAARREINRHNNCNLLITVVHIKLILYSYNPEPDLRYLLPTMMHRHTR